MINQSSSAFPIVKQDSSLNEVIQKQSAKSLVLALCLSLLPALGIGATSYHFVNQAIAQHIAPTESDKPSIPPALQQQLQLELIFLSGVTALLSSAISFVVGGSAIATLLSRHSRLHSSKPQYSKPALLFGEIASQSQPVDLNYLYKLAVDGAREILQVDRVMIYTFDADWTGTITAESVAPERDSSLGNQIVDTCMRDSKGGLYKNGRVCVINDIYQADLSDCHIQLLEKFQVKANMVVPILKDEQLLGLLIAHQCDRPRIWQPNEIDFLVQLAALIALRLSNLNFLEQRTKSRQESSFSNMALRIRQSLDPEEVFKTAAKEIQQALNVDRVVICRLSSNLQDGLVVAESVLLGWPQMLGIQLANLGIAEHHLEMFKTGYDHPINNMVQESTLNNTQITLTNQYKIKASLVAPIRTGNKLRGLIVAHQCSATRTWEQSTVNLFEELTTQVSLALEQATLMNSVAAEAQRTQLLVNFTSRIRQSLNSKDILSTSLEEILNTLEADRVLIYRFNPDGKSGEITAQAIAPGWTPAQKENIDKLFQDQNFTGYKTGNIWVTHDVYADNLTPAKTRLLERLQIKASIVAPIVATDQLVGLLCAHQCSDCRDWQQSEFYSIQQFAAQIGFALDQTQLMDQLNVVYTQQQQQTDELRRQLISLVRDIEEAAKGNLTVRAEVTTGEFGTLGDFFNSVIESLRRIVTQVKVATTQVNASLGDNKEAIRQLADVAFKQAQETTRTLDSVEQMTHSIQAVANSAYHAAAVARTASATAEAGTEAMAHTAQKIMNLRETVGEAAKKVKRLGDSSKEISKVVSLINQIALQTNLLALNAGIEAARAGEEGQSFAVVAKEVGELAARSSAATQEIEQIVENIQLETRQVVEAMERGTTQVVEGTQLVAETKQSLGRILEVSHQIDQLVQSISSATVSQVETSSTLTDLMKEMAKVSEWTSTSSHEISSSLEQTVDIAQQLQSSVGVFKVDATNN
ncbi:MAG TPA: chemotaxis protein [Cyanobacteria bacterium UBA8543]|nr:chemotaxis protein [Cyanobacteria bacterium UBA8543]